MDNHQPEGKHRKIMKRSKKRPITDSEKKSAKSEDTREKQNAGVAFLESESGQDLTDTTLTEAGADGVSGDANSETLSLNLALSLILDHKKKELLECPEVIQLLQQVSRNP